MDDKSLQIARFLARGTDHYDRFHPYVHDPSGLGQFELIDLNSTAGYLLIAQRASEYAANRYGSLRFSPELLAQKTEVIHTVDNPMNSIAYFQARLLATGASLLPSEFLRRKISGTAASLLAGQDVVIYRLGTTP